jgi:predicted GH43/DUF377 family glycosyl hydrolase
MIATLEIDYVNQLEASVPIKFKAMPHAVHVNKEISLYRPVPTLAVQAEALGFKAGIFNFGMAEQKNIHYFNSAVVKRPDGEWLIVRRAVIADNNPFGMNDLWAFKLDQNRVPAHGFRVNTEKRFLDEHKEDCRAVYHNGLTWIVCCNFCYRFYNQKTNWTGAHQMIVAVDDKWTVVKRFDPVYGGNGPDLSQCKHSEKNWIVFFNNNRLHVDYGINPHVVLEIGNNGDVAKEYSTQADLSVWKYGTPRGGTNPVLIGNEYFTFFHSSTNWRTRKPARQYHMGAIAFEHKPPFRITRISKSPLLSGNPDDEWVCSKPMCVFPCGLVFDGKNHFITGGSNDLQTFWTEISHEQLVQGMVKV